MTDARAARQALRQPSYRSPLRVWMVDHGEALWPGVATRVPPNGAALAARLAQDGVRAGRGRPPTRRCVRDAWRQVIAAHQLPRQAVPDPTGGAGVTPVPDDNSPQSG